DCVLLLAKNDGRRAQVGIGTVGGQWRELNGLLEGVGRGRVGGVHEARQVAGGAGGVRPGVHVGIGEVVGEAVSGRALRHGGDGGAPEVSGALIVAAGLLESSCE